MLENKLGITKELNNDEVNFSKYNSLEEAMMKEFEGLESFGSPSAFLCKSFEENKNRPHYILQASYNKRFCCCYKKNSYFL